MANSMISKKVLILLIAVNLLGYSMGHTQEDIKKPNVSGQFYTDNSAELMQQVDSFLDKAMVEPYEQSVPIVIAPHAGYYFSGAVAGYSFKAVKNQKIRTVVVMGPSHHFNLDGVAIWEKGGFETPLGTIDIDEDFSQALGEMDEAFVLDRKVFEKEHALEVELPFIQRAFPEAKLVPIIIGVPVPKVLLDLAKGLDQLIGQRDDVLVVVSTDFSHFHPDEMARDMDATAIEAIKNLQAERIYQECRQGSMEMCGCMPVTAALLLAKLRGLNNVDLLKYNNSGDVNQDKESVVGYSALAIYARNASDDNALKDGQKKRLLQIARDAVVAYVSQDKKISLNESDERLLTKEGAFVSVYVNDQLRGCIGHILGDEPLCHTVSYLALSSATEDTRFEPIRKDELDQLHIEISVLSIPKRIFNTNLIEMGKHGVIISSQGRRGVFLPQVATSTGWTTDVFLSELCQQKAGLPADCWKDPQAVTIEIFTADVFSDKNL